MSATAARSTKQRTSLVTAPAHTPGRFKNSRGGNEEIVKHAKKGDELTFSIAGAGYEKQDEKAAG
ncbi:hypothetical protein [Pseudomonas sp. EYE_354]|uniref:hypothetical protein n=1 Tax=Pseudomonas sp. EYE_354 TaxID=2853449 RepID=UPI002002CACA|nr:hypothetical protein [Pseudomonas sp. EYE_354]MCK6189792.1 hypothetical protein [Pseudomonas sp. EYE_354]